MTGKFQILTLKMSFAETRAAIMAIVNQRKADDGVVAQWISWMEQVESEGKLADPFEANTGEFLDDLSPKAVSMILNTGKVEKETRELFEQVLMGYVGLIPAMIAGGREAFLEKCSCRFYWKKFSRPSNTARISLRVPAVPSALSLP